MAPTVEQEMHRLYREIYGMQQDLRRQRQGAAILHNAAGWVSQPHGHEVYQQRIDGLYDLLDQTLYVMLDMAELLKKAR